MIKNNIFNIITVLFILFLSRILPHPPNFTPILSVCILSYILFNDKILGLAIVLTSMFLTDLFLGFHTYQLVVYLTLVSIGLFSPKNKNYGKLLLISIAGSVWFFIATNFAVWIIWDFYEKSFEGLIMCYTLALPFFGNTLIGTILFTGILTYLLKYVEILNEKTTNIINIFIYKFFITKNL
jgi:hypothetical protein